MNLKSNHRAFSLDQKSFIQIKSKLQLKNVKLHLLIILPRLKRANLSIHLIQVTYKYT